jgi:hypothetical protein
LIFTSHSGATYALALLGLLQQAADAGVSPAEWIVQFSADAQDDGILNTLGVTRGPSLLQARMEFIYNLSQAEK